MKLIYNFLSTFRNNFLKKKIFMDVFFNVVIIQLLKIFLKKGLIIYFKKLSNIQLRIFFNIKLVNKINFDYSIHNYLKFHKNKINRKKKSLFFVIFLNNKKKIRSKSILYKNSNNKKDIPYIYIYY